MKLRVTRRAVSDLRTIADYVGHENPAAAGRVRAALLDSLRMLVRFPRLGRRQTIEGVRKLVTRPYGYVVYYLADETEEEIVILTIQHPARGTGP